MEGSCTVRVNFNLSTSFILLIIHNITVLIYSVIKKDGLNFVRLYFLNYTWYVNNLHNI